MSWPGSPASALSIAAGDGDVWVVDGRGELVGSMREQTVCRTESRSPPPIRRSRSVPARVADPVGGCLASARARSDPAQLPLGSAWPGSPSAGAPWATNESPARSIASTSTNHARRQPDRLGAESRGRGARVGDAAPAHLRRGLAELRVQPGHLRRRGHRSHRL
jgi:hypothetical protein